MADRILSLLTELLIQSTLIMAAVFLLRAIFGNKLDKRVRYYLWIPVMLRLMIPFSVSSRISIMNLLPDRGSIALTALHKSGPAALSNSPAIGNTGNASILLSWKMLIPVVWILGVFLVSAFIIWGNVRFRIRLKNDRREVRPGQLKDICSKLKIRHLPKVYISGLTDSPCAAGIIRPVIYLPEWTVSSSCEELRFILIHELTHIRQKDNLYALFTSICCAVYWFDPFVWIMGKIQSADREAACDAWVIRDLEDIEKTMYGLSIISAVKKQTGRKTPGLATAFASDKKSMMSRVRYIKNSKPCAKSLTVIVTAVMLLAFVSFGTSAKTKNNTPAVNNSKTAYARIVSREFGECGAVSVFDRDIMDQILDCFVMDSSWTRCNAAGYLGEEDVQYVIIMCGDDNSPHAYEGYALAVFNGEGVIYSEPEPDKSYCLKMSDEKFKSFQDAIEKLKAQ